MATSSDARRDAIYAVISAQDNFKMLTEQEKALVKANLGVIFAADLAYLVAQIDVLPTNLYDPPGASVATSTGAGAVTGTSAIQGTGKIR